MKKTTKKSKKVTPSKRLKKYEEGGKEVTGLKKNPEYDAKMPAGVTMPKGDMPYGSGMEMKLKSEAVPADKLLKKIEMPDASVPSATTTPSAKAIVPKAKAIVPKAKLLPGGFTSEAQKAAYIKNVKAKMANGATIDQLVKYKVGTKAGLEGLGLKDTPAKAKPSASKPKASSPKSSLPKLITNSSLDNVKDAMNKNKASKKSKPDYVGKTNSYTNKKGTKTSERLTMTGGKPTLTRTTVTKAGDKTVYVKSGDKMYLKTSDGKVKNLQKAKVSNFDKVQTAKAIAKGNQKKEIATGAASSVDDFWTLPIGGAVKTVGAIGAGLVARTLIKKAGKKITTDLANKVVRSTASGLLKNSAANTMGAQMSKQAFLNYIKQGGSKATQQKIKQMGINAAGNTSKLTREALGKEFAKNVSSKGSQKLLAEGTKGVVKTGSSKGSQKLLAEGTKGVVKTGSKTLKPDRIIRKTTKALNPGQKMLGRTINVSGRTVSSGSQKALNASQKLLQQGSKASKSTAAKVNQVAKNKSLVRNAKNSKIEASIKTNNPVARKMAKESKVEQAVKTGYKKVKTSVKNAKVRNAKPKPGDQLKLDLKRGGGKFSYGGAVRKLKSGNYYKEGTTKSKEGLETKTQVKYNPETLTTTINKSNSNPGKIKSNFSTSITKPRSYTRYGSSRSSTQRKTLD